MLPERACLLQRMHSRMPFVPEKGYPKVPIFCPYAYSLNWSFVDLKENDIIYELPSFFLCLRCVLYEIICLGA